MASVLVPERTAFGCREFVTEADLVGAWTFFRSRTLVSVVELAAVMGAGVTAGTFRALVRAGTADEKGPVVKESSQGVTVVALLADPDAPTKIAQPPHAGVRRW
ncbi:hypothetical protein [Streptomyces sp. NPDC001675]